MTGTRIRRLDRQVATMVVRESFDALPRTTRPCARSLRRWLNTRGRHTIDVMVVFALYGTMPHVIRMVLDIIRNNETALTMLATLIPIARLEPAAEERLWIEIDRRLGGRARAIRAGAMITRFFM